MVSCLSTLLIWRSKHAMHWMLCYVDTVDTGVFTPHSTLYKVLSKSQCLDKHSIQCIMCFDLCVDSVDKQDTIHSIQKHCYIYYILYVDTVDTGQWSLMHSMLSMSTLSIQNKYTCFCPKLSKYSTNFQSAKRFGKLWLRAFQPYHQILYMLTLSKQDKDL